MTSTTKLILLITLIGIIYFFVQLWVKHRNVHWTFVKGAIIPLLFFLSFMVLGTYANNYGLESGDEIAYYSIALISGVVVIVYLICVVLYQIYHKIKDNK